jgi:iron complex transport system substrate-binding protein
MTKIKNGHTMKKALTILIMIAMLAAIAFAGCTSGSGSAGGSATAAATQTATAAPTATGTETQTDSATITITDVAGRSVVVPDNPSKIAVSGSGSSRYFAWLGATDKMVAVDFQDSSLLKRKAETRPYMLANPQIKELQVLGSSKGVVDPELLMKANPEVVFMSGISDTIIQNANELTEKTGIPVVLFYSGDYVTSTAKVEESLRTIAKVLHKEQRAEDVIKYFADTRADLESRAAKADGTVKPTVYIGGVSYNGAHGFDGSDPTYYPFTVLSANNVAAGLGSTASTGYAAVSKEQIIGWDPEIIFVDLNTMEAAGGGGIYELQTDPSYRELTAVKTGKIYALNPHTSMGTNHETSMANAYYVGKVLYPDLFADIDPEAKADEIYTFVDGAPVFKTLKENMENLSYTQLKI